MHTSTAPRSPSSGFRFRFRALPAGLVVTGLVVLLALAFFAPGSLGLWLPLVVALLAVVVLVNRGMAQLVLGLLAAISPPVEWALGYSRRRQEYLGVIRRMNEMLQRYGLPELDAERQETMADNPPNDPGDHLAVCSETVARELFPDADASGAEEVSWWRRTWRPSVRKGRARPWMADVLELLYRDHHGLQTADTWKRLGDEQREEVARILVDGGALPEIEESDRMVDLVVRVLDALDGPYHLPVVQGELEVYLRLWAQVCGVLGYLESEGIGGGVGLDEVLDWIDRLHLGGLMAKSYDELEHRLLLTLCEERIRAWVRSREADAPAGGPGPSPGDVKPLTCVALGHHASRQGNHHGPLLRRLGAQAARPPALHMLLADLWRRSRLESGDAGPTLAELALGWRKWSGVATKEMGGRLTAHVQQELESGLRAGVWPRLLPIQKTMDDIIQQTRAIWSQMEQLKKAEVRDAAWHRRLQTILDWTERTITAQDHEVPLETRVMEAVEARLRELLPAAQRRAPGPPVDADELERRYDEFAGRFRPETRLLGTLGSYASVFHTLALFRERAAELAEKLDELSWMLQAESTGGSAYLVTFDQVRGGLAHLIDQLREKYGFRHYTRYSRIGVLPEGESFEDLYRRFEMDLEDLVADAVAAADASPEEQWEQLEITVQQISLLHRHDFVIDAEKSLRDRLRPHEYSRVFRLPPSSHALDELTFAAPAAVEGAGEG